VLLDEARTGLGHRDTDARRFGASRSEAQEEAASEAVRAVVWAVVLIFFYGLAQKAEWL
jgi:hypothetical protein